MQTVEAVCSRPSRFYSRWKVVIMESSNGEAVPKDLAPSG